MKFEYIFWRFDCPRCGNNNKLDILSLELESSEGSSDEEIINLSEESSEEDEEEENEDEDDVTESSSSFTQIVDRQDTNSSVNERDKDYVVLPRDTVTDKNLNIDTAKER